jgi:hypothetical protein
MGRSAGARPARQQRCRRGRFTGAIDLRLSFQERRRPRHRRRQAERNRAGSGQGHGREGYARPRCARILHFADRARRRGAGRGEHRVWPRQFREDAGAMDSLERASQESAAAQGHARRHRQRDKCRYASHLLGNGDRRRLREATGRCKPADQACIAKTGSLFVPAPDPRCLPAIVRRLRRAARSQAVTPSSP